MGILQKILGASGLYQANVDAAGSLQVTGPTDKTKTGYNCPAIEVDAGAITGTRLFKSQYVSHDDRLSVGIDTQSALYNFTTTAQNTGKFKHAFTTMTMTQSGGFLNINPTLATVSGNYAFLQSWKHFTVQGDGDLHVEMTGQISAMPPTNQIFEAGLFLGTAGVAPADGVFFRLSASGLEGVIISNGTPFSTGIFMASLPLNTNGKYTIIVTQRHVCFWVDGNLGGFIDTPAALAVPYLTMNLPLCFMMRNSGTVVGGCTVKIGTTHVSQCDLHTSKPWSEQMTTQGNAYQGQDGDTMGSLAAYSNAALSAAAALTNTTAAAPNTGLGGAVLVLPTLTAGTDGILFSYLNPIGSITQPPKTLVVTGVSIDAGVQLALTGGPLTLVMGVAYGHTLLSLATAETGSFVTATVKAPRRVPLGILSFIAAAVAGTGVTKFTVPFKSPIVVNPGEYFAITCRNVSIVTTAGALAMTACVDHYFE
jgi:hypothetical protein